MFSVCAKLCGRGPSCFFRQPDAGGSRGHGPETEADALERPYVEQTVLNVPE